MKGNRFQSLQRGERQRNACVYTYRFDFHEEPQQSWAAEAGFLKTQVSLVGVNLKVQIFLS